jgi:ornithine carbamoyltransferase
VRDTARVVGRMYDGIEFRGFAHQDVEDLAQYAGVPVWNGLTDRWHPTQMLADMLTMRDSSKKPLEEIAYCYIGDARNNTANSLLITGALLGMDTRICGPRSLWPAEDIVAIARSLSERSGARLSISEDLEEAVRKADFLYTDEVFESAASIVFDQAENRLHTIKTVMVATLSGPGEAAQS